MTPPLACPHCRAPLSPPTHEVTCPCGYESPVLGGVPLLVPEPAVWCARYRESAIASLVEFGKLEPDDLARLDTWALAASGISPDRFSDDWVPSEVGAQAPASAPVGTTAAHEFGRWLEAVQERPLEARLTEALAAVPTDGWGLEVGCGAATATRALSARGPLLSGDLSLRAALHAQGAGATAALFDAQALPFADGSLDWVVSANVVDLLDDPAGFLLGVHACLRPGGRLVLSTPDPGLGSGDDLLVPLLDELGYAIDHVEDGVPWVRAHHRRHFEVYFNQVVVVTRL